MAGRVSALSVPVDGSSAVEFRAFAARTPLLSVCSGRVLVTFSLPAHLRASDVEFARRLAEHAVAYATEVERSYRGAGNRSSRSSGKGAAA